MSSRVLLAGGVGLLVVAGLLAPAPEARTSDPLAALGRSLGGMRIPLVDMLFLRAERLRRTGDVDEVPALYEAVERLDPDNAAAADFLAATYAYDLMADAPDADARLAWWEAAWRLLQEAIARHPRDASLRTRAGDLLLDVLARHPEIAAGVRARVPDPAARGLDELVRAARITAYLPRRGRFHLDRLALWLPYVAAGRLDARDAASRRHLLAEGEEVLRLRRDALAKVRLDLDHPADTLDVVMAESLRAVETIAALWDSKDPEAGAKARAALERLAAHAPDTPVLTRLTQEVKERW